MTFDPRSHVQITRVREDPVTRFVEGVGIPGVERRLVIDVLDSLGDEPDQLFECPAFDASDTSFPPHECGSCGLWECNSSDSYAVWVRRWPPYVLWLYPYGRVRAFDGAAYEAALGGSAAALPALTKVEVQDRADWPEATPVSPDEDRVYRWPFDDVAIVPVAPPREAVELGGRWFARDGGHWLAYLPAVFGLPVWLGGPVIDDLALPLLDGHPLLR